MKTFNEISFSIFTLNAMAFLFFAGSMMLVLMASGVSAAAAGLAGGCFYAGLKPLGDTIAKGFGVSSRRDYLRLLAAIALSCIPAALIIGIAAAALESMNAHLVLLALLLGCMAIVLRGSTRQFWTS